MQHKALLGLAEVRRVRVGSIGTVDVQNRPCGEVGGLGGGHTNPAEIVQMSDRCSSATSRRFEPRVSRN